jgi:general secretion pathway protein D
MCACPTDQPVLARPNRVRRQRENQLDFSGRAALVLMVVSVSVGGCVTTDQGNKTKTAVQPPPTDMIREVDLGPRFPRHVGSGVGQGSKSGPRAQVYNGDSTATATTDCDLGPLRRKRVAGVATTGSVGTEKGYELNFANTPIPTVAKAVLGDILGIFYVIDPRVKGTISLSSGRAVPRGDLLYVLGDALRVSNVALVREGQGYRLVPTTDAFGAGPLDPGENPGAGYGVSVIPLEYVSAPVLIKLIENFAAKPGMVRADNSRNLLLIQGTASDRRNAIETALSFDVDWMRCQSVGIYPISNSTPEPIIAELDQIIGAGEGGLSQNVVKLQAVNRENAVLVVTRSPTMLKRVGTWIKKLDRPGGADTGVSVYRMQYGDAKQVAALLNDIFLGNSGGLDTAANQLVPGGGVVASSSSRSPLGGSQKNSAGLPTQNASAGSSTPTATPASFDSRFGKASSFAHGIARAASSAMGRSDSAGPLLANVRIAPDAVNNALIIYANQENYRIIQRALRQIDRPQLQVAIDATIAEVTLNDNLQYGVQFYLNSQDVGLNPDQGSVFNSGLATSVTGAVLNQVLPGFNFLVGTAAQPRLIIDALRAVTEVRVLSRPSLVVIDNQVASLRVGDQIPITTQTAQSLDTATAPVVNSISYKNTGVILRVQPRINANGNVQLSIQQEISSLVNNSAANTLTPTVSERSIESAVSVASGQTVLLGGLISETQENDRSTVPGLERVPVIGELFSHKTGTRQRTELIIFIRPQIIRNGVDAARVAEELRSKMRNFGGYPPPHHPLTIHK